ncbi:hypothetical protein BHYA_0063g00420 [Botrytis hyacinthi]|uniref:Uncharacterized protein n=1 Tax=Botrytis hyacinthi TaxID=278943 RepID=A0A4Z1H0M2_9HELO|nr:hypothetical protein BHYA_0063g00420 [Botrytis hyacinthi]
METDSEQSSVEAATRNYHWTLRQEESLARPIQKHKKRVEDGEDERTTYACARKWNRMGENQLKLGGNAFLNGTNWDADFDGAGEFITDGDEVYKGPSDMIDKNKKTRGAIWSEEESRILYEEVKALQELSNQEESPKLTSAAQLFNHVSALHKDKGYSRSPGACHSYWHVTGRELWDCDERVVEYFKTNDARNAKVTNSSFKANEIAVEDAKKSSRIAINHIAKETLNPSTEQKEKVAKDHGISVFQVPSYFANKRSTKKKELAKNSLDHGSSKRKQSERLGADFADSSESIVAREDDVLRDAKKPRLLNSSQLVQIDGKRSSQQLLAIEKDVLQDLTTPTLRSTTPEREFGSSYTPIEIDSPPLQSSEPRNTNLNNSLYTAEFKEAMLTQRRLMEEQITELTKREEKLLKKALAHEVTADLGIEAYNAVQNEIVEEEESEAELKLIKDWEKVSIHK